MSISITWRNIKTYLQILKNRVLFKLLTIRRIQYRRKLQKSFRGTSSRVSFPYRYGAGRYASTFLAALRDGKILASRCTNCKTTLVPCRLICGNCLQQMTETVELSGEGRLLSFTQVSFPFIDPFTGRNRPVPYCYGMILLDGTDNTFQGLLDVRHHHSLRSGLRVRAVFLEKRSGQFDDIKYFEIEEDTHG